MSEPASERPPGRRAAYPLILAVALAAAGAALLAHSFAARYSTGVIASAPNAMTLPRTLLGLWVALALAVAAAELRARTGGRADLVRPALWLGGLLLLAAVLLPVAGFALTVTPLVAACLVALGERRPVPLLFATALLGPGLWYLFHHVFLIRLPSIMPGGAF